VENAVKHGIGMKEEGGTVTIKVREYADTFKIIISDDGVGFDPDAIDNRERQHIGLENVKNRLLLMCDAILSIESELGKGTSITISLPKVGAEQ
jgi:sensor histidine kinase YesM